MNRLRALGALDLRDETGRELRTLLAQPKRVALLVYLSTATPRSFHRRDSLVALLWPELDTEHARNALRQALHFLRNGLGAGTLTARGAEEIAIAAEHLAVDVIDFETALDAGQLEHALELYRGDLLPGFFISEAPVFERWLDERRATLRGRAAAAAWELSRRAEAATDRAAAIHWGRRAMLLAIDDETGVRRLLELHLRLGDRRGALRAYQDFAAQLRKEFEVEPSAETQALIAGARTPVPAQSPPRPPDAVPAATSTVPESTPLLLPRPTTPTTAWTPRRLAAAFVGLVFVILTISMASRRADPGASSARAVTVLPFPVRGRPDLAYLREGMVDLLSAKLDGVLGLRSVDPRAVLAAVQQSPDSGHLMSPERAGEIADRLGASYFVVGDIVEIAGRVNVNGALYRGSRRLAAASAAGESTQLFQLVDDLTGQLLVPLSEGRDTALTRLAAVTTHSLPALKAYLDGERALRLGNEAQAGTAFRSAALLDTAFALAQYRLALTATWVTVPEVSDPAEWADRAARNASRLSPLGRDLLDAYRAYKGLQLEEAENAYRAITESHPDNVEAWLMLGETRFHYIPLLGRSPAESRLPFERALALDPGNPHALLHLARLAARQGWTDRLNAAADDYLTRYPRSERALEMRALQAYNRRDSLGRAAVLSEAMGAGDYALSSLLIDAAWYAQDLRAARPLIESVMSITTNQMALILDQRVASELGLMSGRWGLDGLDDLPEKTLNHAWLLESQALLASEPFFEIPTAQARALRDSLAAVRPYGAAAYPVWGGAQNRVLGPLMQHYIVGLLGVRLGDTAAVARSAAALAAATDMKLARTAQSLRRGLRAEVARARGDFRSALAEIESFDFGTSTRERNISH
ncbi:MAG TPA: BTAD domain-containing putative transcriptional regulator, partial [Gemmatimonadales bacterium]|nr:BTAD domain-containing putative transcriptional regulator [Gemmatimonadales bacterium]